MSFAVVALIAYMYTANPKADLEPLYGLFVVAAVCDLLIATMVTEMLTDAL